MSLDDRIDKPAQTGRRFIRGREIEPTILKRGKRYGATLWGEA